MVISSPDDLFVIVVMDPAGGLTITGPDLLQLTGHVVKRDDFASLEDVSNHVIGPVRYWLCAHSRSAAARREASLMK